MQPAAAQRGAAENDGDDGGQLVDVAQGEGGGADIADEQDPRHAVQEGGDHVVGGSVAPGGDALVPGGAGAGAGGGQPTAEGRVAEHDAEQQRGDHRDHQHVADAVAEGVAGELLPALRHDQVVRAAAVPDAGQPGHDLAGGQRRHQRAEAQVLDQEPVDDAAREPGQQRVDDRQRHRAAASAALEHEHHADDRDHRRHTQVDAAAADDQRLPKRRDHQHAEQRRDGGHAAVVDRRRVQDHADHQQHQRHRPGRRHRHGPPPETWRPQPGAQPGGGAPLRLGCCK